MPITAYKTMWGLSICTPLVIPLLLFLIFWSQNFKKKKFPFTQYLINLSNVHKFKDAIRKMHVLSI